MEDLYSDTDLQKFHGGGQKKRGPKKSPLSSKTSKERAVEPPNEDNCQARTWGVGYGPQCIKTKSDGGCLCKMHQGKLVDGKWWLGMITEPRPEEPMQHNGNHHYWKITTDGIEIVTGRKVKKTTGPKCGEKLTKKSQEALRQTQTLLPRRFRTCE